MNVFKVSAKHAWGPWHDFRFVVAADKKNAIMNALSEMEVPDVANEKIVLTVSRENPIKKIKKERKV